jgi:hypothetical protein
MEKENLIGNSKFKAKCDESTISGCGETFKPRHIMDVTMSDVNITGYHGLGYLQL